MDRDHVRPTTNTPMAGGVRVKEANNSMRKLIDHAYIQV